MAIINDNPDPVRPPKGHFQMAGKNFPRIKWWKVRNMRLLYFYIITLIITNTANGFDNSMMNGLQSLIYWQDYFNHPHGGTLGLLNCVMSAGALAGLIFISWMLDHLGRKTSLTIGSGIMLLGIALQAAATNFSMFVGGRFILGFGDIIINVTAPLLICEISPPQDRAILVTIQGATYFSGAFIAAWVTYGTLKIPNDWSWRAPSLIQAVFTIFMLTVLYWIPESPRYYMSKDKTEEAMKVLATYHTDKGEHDELVQLEFHEIQTALRFEKEAEHSSSFLDFVRTEGNRRRLYIIVSIGLFAQWSGGGLVSYYLNLVLDSIGITDPNQQLLINGGITSFNLATNFFFSFFVNIWGRRPIYLFSAGGTLLSYIIWTILSERYAATNKEGFAQGVLAMIFIYNLFYNVKSGLLASYTTEILPFNLRAKGFTIMEVAQYGALFFNQYVNPIALDAIAWKYYIVYCVFLAFECVFIYFIYVETRYIPLEEVAKRFDGDDIAAAANAELKSTGVEITYVETIREESSKV